MPLRTIRRKIAAFMRRPLWIRLWFAPVWVLLGVCKLLIFTAPFRRFSPWLGVCTDLSPWVPLVDERQAMLASRIGQVVRLAVRYTPWDSNCFPQALAARVLLGMYGIPYAMYFGVMRQGGAAKMEAHAWVASGQVRVTGGESFDRFTVVGCFVAPGLRPWLDA